jgi:hypothetical protein
MINFLLDLLLGCSHRRTTFPLTRGSSAHTYVACLECGKEFPYNWIEMRIEKSPAPRPAGDNREYGHSRLGRALPFGRGIGI